MLAVKLIIIVGVALGIAVLIFHFTKKKSSKENYISSPTSIKNKLIKMLKTTKDILDKNNIAFFADSGTALGCIRHRGFIPHDHDIDLGVASTSIENILKLKPLFEKHNLILRYTDGHTIREIDSKESKEFRKMIADPTRLQKFIDDFDYKSRVQKGAFYKIINKSDDIYGGCDMDLFLYAYDKTNDNYPVLCNCSTSLGKEVYFKDIGKTILSKYEDIQIPIVIDTLEYLDRLYGRDCVIKDEHGNLI